MLLLIISGALLIIGVIAAILYNRGPRWAYLKNWVLGITLFALIISLSGLLFCGIASLNCYTDYPEDIVRLQTEYFIITSDLQQLNEADLLHTWTIKDSIIEYNTEIYKHKRFVDSPWIGIFYSKEIAAMPLIELGG